MVRRFHNTLLPKVGQDYFLKILLQEVLEKFTILVISEELLAYCRNKMGFGNPCLKGSDYCVWRVCEDIMALLLKSRQHQAGIEPDCHSTALTLEKQLHFSLLEGDKYQLLFSPRYKMICLDMQYLVVQLFNVFDEDGDWTSDCG